MERLRCQIIDQWASLAWDGWWGDSMDVRFELCRLVRRLTAARVLDVGCGHGVLLGTADPGSVRVGVDQCLQRLKSARGICPGAHFVVADMERLPFRRESFAVIVLAGVLEYVHDRTRFLRQVGELATPGAQVLATTPNVNYWAYRRHPRLLDHTQVCRAFAAFPWRRIRGYNPLPPMPFMVPPRVLSRLPQGWFRYLLLPSPLLARLPGVSGVLRWLMRFQSLIPLCKGFLIEARVAQLPGSEGDGRSAGMVLAKETDEEDERSESRKG